MLFHFYRHLEDIIQDDEGGEQPELGVSVSFEGATNLFEVERGQNLADSLLFLIFFFEYTHTLRR